MIKLIHPIRKVEKINSLIIVVYGLFILFPLVTRQTYHVPIYPLLIDLVGSMGILFAFNHRVNQEPMYQRSPLYYYVFIVLVLVTFWLTGLTESVLFPHLFVLPVLYVSINFSRRGSIGISILSIVSIWLLLAGDFTLENSEEALIISVINLALPILFGYIAKEHISHMRKLMILSKIIKRDGQNEKV